MTTNATPTQKPLKKSLVYIQRRGDGYLETVDEFETMKEARAMHAEYRLSDPSAHFYTSRRPCKNWRD